MQIAFSFAPLPLPNVLFSGSRRVASKMGDDGGLDVGGGRGIVQYYPDNQNKYLFRKSVLRPPDLASGGKLGSADKGYGERHAQQLKDSLVRKEGEGGQSRTDFGLPVPNRVRDDLKKKRRGKCFICLVVNSADQFFTTILYCIITYGYT